jgi:hypothetical protein
MSLREYAASVLASLSEEKIYEFIQLFADENTLARIESEMMINDNNAPVFQSADELLEELDD